MNWYNTFDSNLPNIFNIYYINSQQRNTYMQINAKKQKTINKY